MDSAEEDEEYFPRGGAKGQIKRIKNDRTYIFQINKPEVVPKKKPGRKERLREKAKKIILENEALNPDEELSNEYIAEKLEPFAYKNLTDGILTMCSVNKIKSNFLVVSLPERKYAKIPINLISQPIKKLTEQDPSSVNLKQYFTIGYCLPCRILKVTNVEDNYEVIATTDPNSINHNIQFNLVCEGYTLLATVQSCEDHGYIMDTGIKGVNAFLSHKDVGDNYDEPLAVGQLLWCKVIKSTLSETSNVIKLTALSNDFSNIVQKRVSSPDILVPGVQVKVTIVKTTPKLLFVKELSSNEKGYIPISHLEHPWSTISDYQIGVEYAATVLYKFPHIDVVCYSLRVKPDATFLPQISAGTIFSRAMVISKNKHNIIVELECNGLLEKGIISMFKLRKAIDVDKLNDLFPVGNHITVRVIDFHNLDGVYSCTTSTCEHASDLKVGKLVDVTIVKQVNKVFFGTVGYVTAIIPLTHTIDDLDDKVQIKLNHIYTGRVWDINDKLLLVTLRPSLVNNKPLKNFNKVKQGDQYFGVVRKILPTGIVVTFFSDLTAVIRDINLPTMPAKYKIGQLVKCHVLKAFPDSKPLLSVTNPLGIIGLKIGFQYPIIVKAISEKGLDCIVLENNKLAECFLPVEHLCDCLKLCPLLLKNYEIGKKIKNSILYTFDDNQKPIFTLRYSVDRFFKEHPDIKENGIFSLKKDDILPATVTKRIDERTVLVDVPLFGYNGKLYAQIPKIMKIKANQGIDVKVKNVVANAKNVTVICDDSKSSLKYARKQLIDFLQALSKFQNRKSGDVIKAKVVSIEDNKVNVLLSDDKTTKGIITRRCDKQFKIDEKISTILLYEDPLENVAHLCYKSEDLSTGNENGLRIVHMEDEFCIGVSIVKNTIVFLNPISPQVLKFWLENCKQSFFSSDFLVHTDRLRTIGKFIVGIVPWMKYLKSVLNSKKSGNKKVKQIKKTDMENIADTNEPTDEDDEELASEDDDEDLEDTLDNMNNTELMNEDNSDEEEEELENDDEEEDDEDNDNELNSSLKQKNKLAVKEKTSTSKKFLKRKSELDNSLPTKRNRMNESAIEFDSSMNETDNEDEGSSTNLKNKKTKSKNKGKNKNKNTDTLKGNKKKRTHDDDDDKNSSCSENDESVIETKSIIQTKQVEKNTKKESEAAKALKQKKLKELENLSLDKIGGFQWNATPADLAKTVAVGKMEILNEDSDEEVLVKKKKKLTPAEKKAAQIEAEKLIREKEEELLRCEQNPQSADHFERLLLTDPNNSKLWIQYMAFHLQGTDIDKARSVALRALKQINVREDKERLNVWIALLNLENIYGSSESFDKTLSDALKYNDDYQVYIKVLGMYCDTQRIAELDKLTNHLVRKFKEKLDCWYECQSALMRIGLTDKARNFLQRSLSSLPQKEHISLISRFALLENKYGFHEQAQSLFDNLLTSYPQRIDLWNVYVDMLVKSGSIDLARGVLERISSHKLPIRKMRTIYKKWLQFEEKYGTEKSVENVRKEAEAYVSDLLLPTGDNNIPSTSNNEMIEHSGSDWSDSDDRNKAEESGNADSDEGSSDSDSDEED